MLRTTARTKIRTLLGARDESGTWTNDVLNDLINLAQQQVWLEMGDGRPHLTAIEAYGNYPAAARSLDLYTGSIATPGLALYPVSALVAVYVLPSAGAPSSTNVPFPIFPDNIIDIENANSVYPRPAATFGAWTYSLGAGNALVIRPVPSAALPIYFLYIPEPVDLTLDTEHIFSGLWAAAHHLVVYRACTLAMIRTREAHMMFLAMEQKQWAAWESVVGTLKQVSAGVRNVFAPD